MRGVTLEPDDGLATLAELLTRYLGGTDGAFAQRLLARTTPEVVLRLDPVEVSSWDYARRMGSATVGSPPLSLRRGGRRRPRSAPPPGLRAT